MILVKNQIRTLPECIAHQSVLVQYSGFSIKVWERVGKQVADQVFEQIGEQVRTNLIIELNEIT